MIKDNPKFGIEYMSINARDADMRAADHREGRIEGHREGLREGRIEGLRAGRQEAECSLVKKKLAKGKSITQIAGELEQTEDYIQKLIDLNLNT